MIHRIVLGALLGAGLGSSVWAAEAARPNIVFIVSDDQGFTDYSFMGHKQLRTPCLDRLASQGLTFTRGYVPFALCSPSLASMVTGLYPHQHGMTGNDPEVPKGPAAAATRGVSEEKRDGFIRSVLKHPCLPDLLAKANYRTLQTGKWWLGDYHRAGFTDGLTGEHQRHGGEGLVIGRQSMQPVFDFIDASRQKGQPFFVWYAPMMPHTPHNPPARFVERFQKAGIPPKIANYWGMVEWFDETCGQLLDYLDAKRLADNTIVVYITDNGWAQTEQGTTTYGGAPNRQAKLTPYELGVRTVLMLRWPGKVKPQRDDEHLASSLDILPTLLKACGLQAPAGLPGVDWLEPGAVQRRKELFGASFTHNMADVADPAASLLSRTAYQGWWKLLVWRQAGRPAELYDLRADPLEEKDLAAQQPDKVAEMTRQLDGWWNPPASTKPPPGKPAINRPAGGERKVKPKKRP